MVEQYMLKRVREKISSDLDSQGRIDAVREVYDDKITISTDLIYDSKNLFKATIAVDGRVVATGHGSAGSIADAEKNAIDNALAVFGVHGGGVKTSTTGSITGTAIVGGKAVTMDTISTSLHAPPTDPTDWRAWGQNIIDDVRGLKTATALKRLWNDNISMLERMKEEDEDKYRVVWEKFQEAKHELSQETS